jgi:DeoR/GlpR family transcriptional regulator of sugar metabolism
MDVPDIRRIEIKKLLLENNSVSVSNLSSIFNVSELTIRRDLKRLKDIYNKLNIKIIQRKN